MQIDVKFIEPVAGARVKTYYQYTAIDDCTRPRVLRIYDRNNQKSAIQFLDHVLEKLPFQVEAIQTDNGAEFQSKLHWHILDRGIRHIYINPATSRLNGKVERSHRIDNEEFYRILDHGIIIDDAQRLQRQAPTMGGLLQLSPPPRRARWTNPLRTTKTENHRDLSVTGFVRCTEIRRARLLGSRIWKCARSEGICALRLNTVDRRHSVRRSV